MHSLHVRCNSLNKLATLSVNFLPAPYPNNISCDSVLLSRPMFYVLAASLGPGTSGTLRVLPATAGSSALLSSQLFVLKHLGHI